MSKVNLYKALYENSRYSEGDCIESIDEFKIVFSYTDEDNDLITMEMPIEYNPIFKNINDIFDGIPITPEDLTDQLNNNIDFDQKILIISRCNGYIRYYDNDSNYRHWKDDKKDGTQVTLKKFEMLKLLRNRGQAIFISDVYVEDSIIGQIKLTIQWDNANNIQLNNSDLTSVNQPTNAQNMVQLSQVVNDLVKRVEALENKGKRKS